MRRSLVSGILKVGKGRWGKLARISKWLTSLSASGRWQMLPIYAAALIVLALVAPGDVPGTLRLLTVCLALAVAAGGVIVSIILPHFTLPPPDGPLEVGVSHLNVTQMDLDAGGKPLARRIAVEVWYPAGTHSGAGSIREGIKEVRRRLSNLNPSRPYVAENVPFIEGAATYPLLLYIPSWSGQRFENTFLLSSLASHGYVVAAMDYPDGEVIRPDVSALPSPTDLTAPMQFSSEKGFLHTLERAELRVRSQAKDAIFVLGRLRWMNENKGTAVFYGRLDRHAIGVLGYSFGGAVAFQTAWLDPGISAVVNLDGWMFGDAAKSGFSTPRLFVSDDTPLPPPSDLNSPDAATRFTAQLNLEDDERCRAQLAQHGGYRLQIAGTRHVNFSDRPFFAAIPRLVGAGPIDPARAASIIERFTLAFFDESLKGQLSPLLSEGQTDFPEAKLEVWTSRSPDLRHQCVRGNPRC